MASLLDQSGGESQYGLWAAAASGNNLALGLQLIGEKNDPFRMRVPERIDGLVVVSRNTEGATASEQLDQFLFKPV